MTNIDRLFTSNFDVLFKNFFESNSSFFPASESKLTHPVDIFENATGLRFEVACTGLTKEDIDIQIEGDILRVSYDKERSEGKDISSMLKYIHRGIAKRSFNLGYKISAKYDLSQAEAEMENGLLSIHIPFAKDSQPKQLQIK
jgi:HSP20 family protein